MSKSIYEYIASSIVDGELPEDFSLPRPNNEDEVIFADGALDGISIYHMPLSNMSEEDYQVMVEAINAISNQDFDVNVVDALFEKLSKNNRAIDIAHRIQEYIIENQENIKLGNLYEYGIGTIQLSNNIECIKYALVILGLLVIKNKESRDVIKTLALCDEFTLYCVKIMKKWENGNDEIFEVAKKVHGWGRIHAVEELRALDPRYEKIRDWILKEGINNNVLPSYSALTCWKNVNIGGILFTDPTYEQFVYLGKMIDALLDESAVQGISTLDKRKEILLKYLEKARNFSLSIDDYVVIYHIFEYAKGVGFLEVSQEAMSILETSNARTVIIDGVKKGKAVDLATSLGIDCKPYILILMRNSFWDAYQLCGYLADNDTYRKQMLGIFKSNLPLNDMIKSPTDSLNFSNDNEMAMLFLLEELRDYPLEGIEFVEVGLQSAPIRVRNAALTVLKNWVIKKQIPLSELLPNFQSLLTKLRDLEPNQGTKEMIDKLINGDTSFEDESKKTYHIEDLSQDTLNILSDAISDIGCWTWWVTNENLVQLEFADVQLYDFHKEEKEAHSSTIALCFSDDAFFTVLDNYKNSEDKDWYQKLHDDVIDSFSIGGFEFAFNDKKFVNEVLNEYTNKTIIKGEEDSDIFSRKYYVAVMCGEVGFIAGGNELEVISHYGPIREKEIVEASNKWWQYWEDYWRLRGSKDAYEKDFACEASIPVSSDKH